MSLTHEERLERFRKLAKKIDAMANAGRLSLKDKVLADDLSEEELNKIVAIYPEWEVGHDYKVGDLVAYEDNLFEVIQDHTSQEDWPPDSATSLFTPKTPSGVIAEWEQPEGSHDAYNEGDLVLFEDEVYKSLIDDNTWSPADYPEGWELQ